MFPPDLYSINRHCAALREARILTGGSPLDAADVRAGCVHLFGRRVLSVRTVVSDPEFAGCSTSGYSCEMGESMQADLLVWRLEMPGGTSGVMLTYRGRRWEPPATSAGYVAEDVAAAATLARMTRRYRGPYGLVDHGPMRAVGHAAIDVFPSRDQGRGEAV